MSAQQFIDHRGTIERPVFVVGAERSGTTMLALMLDAHPLISWGGEMQYLVDYMPNGENEDLQRVHDSLSMDRGFRLRGLSIDKTLNFSDLARSLLVQRTTSDSAVVGATVHWRFDRILDIWPDARFVHLVRDPRDVSRSVVGMGWAGNTWVGAETWIEAEALWDRLRKKLPEDRFVELFYESLVTNPPEELTKLCEFFGIEYDERMLTYPDYTTYAYPDPKIAQTWKRKATPREIRLAEARIGTALLQSRGYLQSDLPPLTVTSFRRLMLRVQNKVAKFLYRARVFGWRFVVAEFAARRIGLHSMRERLVLRRHRIVNMNLK